MPISPQDLEEAIQQITTDSDLYHDITHGPAAGPGSTVMLESGPCPTILKAISDLTAAIIAGNANGYVATWADNAARALLVPEQVGQLGIQLDTKDIYYAPTTAMGSWIKHPVQDAADDAAAALAAVAALTADLAGKMSTADYVGGAAAGIVRTAERLQAVAAFIVANGTSALNMYGVENGVADLYPVLQNHRCVALSDGFTNHTTVSNTSRRAQGVGCAFAMVNSPRRLVSWGAQNKAGILGSGTSGTQSQFPRPAIARQQPDRNLPGFNPAALFTAAGMVAEVSSQGAATMIRTVDGLIMTAGAVGQGVRPLFGSGVDKTQSMFMPIYFDSLGVNQTIRMFDCQDLVAGTNQSMAIFCDDTDKLWILTTNAQNAGYGMGYSGDKLTPAPVTNGAWAGKIVQKVRCDPSGGMFVLFTDGELWGGGGNNTTGYLGTGGTGNVLNPTQLATAVDDFELTGQEGGASQALWLWTGGDLKAAGYNGNGQLGQGNTTNKSNFVTVLADAEKVWLGGTNNITVIIRDGSGDYWGLGRNADGGFGQGTSATTNHTPVELTNMKAIIDANGGLLDLTISGYQNKHSVCIVCNNGKAFAAGNNTDGVLGNGTTASTSTFTEVLWSPRDVTEKIVDCSSAVGPNGGPAFTWRTNHGRILQAGAGKQGFATGLTPADTNYNVLVAAPVQLGTL